MVELSKAHGKALMPSFGDGKEDQHRIEDLTHEITDLLKKSEKRLMKLSTSGPSEDINIRKNVQVEHIVLRRYASQLNGKQQSAKEVSVWDFGRSPVSTGHSIAFVWLIASVSLDLCTLSTIKNVCGSMKCVAVIISGRPIVIQPYLANIDALVAAWLPGTEGQGVVDVLFGEFGFTGKLARTWFKSVDQLPMNVGDSHYDPLFPFGFGLTTEPGNGY